MAKEKIKKIGKREYLIAFLLLIAVVALTIYFFQVYNLSKQERYNESYLINNNFIQHEIKNLSEMNSVLSEAPAEYFLYISYTGSKETYELEKDMSKIIADYDLNDIFYYLNVTGNYEKEEFYSSINGSLSLENRITAVPTVLHYVEYKLVDVIKRDDKNILEAGDFQKFLDVNEYVKAE